MVPYLERVLHSRSRFPPSTCPSLHPATQHIANRLASFRLLISIVPLFPQLSASRLPFSEVYAVKDVSHYEGFQGRAHRVDEEREVEAVGNLL